MKTCSLYGFLMALASALLTLVLYFAGFHSDPAKLDMAKHIGNFGSLAIGVAFTILGIRARRAEVPVSEGFGYSRAFGAGVQISLVSAALGAAFTYLYNTVINPGFVEILIQDQTEKLQARGMSGAQLDQAERFTRFMMGTGVLSLLVLVSAFIVGVILSAIVAGFIRRPAPAVPPPV